MSLTRNSKKKDKTTLQITKSINSLYWRIIQIKGLDFKSTSLMLIYKTQYWV